jgi:hypothetical protein
VRLNSPLIFDEPKLAELVHEMARSGPTRADNLGKVFLTDLGQYGLWPAFLAKIRQEQKQASKPFLA